MGYIIPGPWKATNGIVKAIDHGRWYTVCRIDKPRFTPEGIESIANLIASAPTMLDALYKIDANAAESVEWIRRVAREAIAKTEGKE